MGKFLILCLCIVAYKTLNNFIKWKQIKYYRKSYEDFLFDKSSRIAEYKLQTIKLFKNAGIKDSSTPVSQPVGYGQIANFDASVFHNFPSKLTIIAQPALEMFDSATGVYRSRVFESFNPLYWIEQILFLPKNILIYVGLDSEQVSFKLCNVLLSFIWWTIGILVTIYGSKINDLITVFLSQFK